MSTRRVVTTWNEIVISFFEVALRYTLRQSVLHYKVDNKRSPFTRRIFHVRQFTAVLI